MRAAFLTDLHLGPRATFEGKLRKMSDQAAPFLRELVNYLSGPSLPRERTHRATPVDVLVNLGDVLEDESPEADFARYGEFVAELTRLPCPALHVAGNHDRIHLSDLQLRELWQVTGLEADQLYYSCDVGGVHLSVLATQETKDIDVRLPAEQLEWLEQDLKRTELATVVCVHHPLSDCVLEGNRWFSQAPNICRIAERKAFRKVIEASGKVLLAVNGHAHWNHFDLIAGIPYITLQSPIENLDADAPGRPAKTFGLLDIAPERALFRVFGEQPAHYQLTPSAALSERLRAAHPE
ncbi:MAG: metallophosphoesterase [Polyangiaceae bacterium]